MTIMKKIYGLTVLFLAVLCCCFLLPSCKKNASLSNAPAADTVSNVLSAITDPVNPNIGGYYLSLPSSYPSTQASYPLLIYMPGAGQFGNGSSDLPRLLDDGVIKSVYQHKLPGSFRSGGRFYSFIILMPQVRTFPDVQDVSDCLSYAHQHWRIDTTRVYVSGLSAGSMASCNMAATYPSRVAALVAMAGVPKDYASTNACQRIAAGRVPVWVFHSLNDPQIDVSVAKGFVDRIRSLNPPISPKLTLWPDGGHDAWTRALDTAYRENGLNIFEWMLQYHH